MKSLHKRLVLRSKILEKPLENDDQVISELKNEKIEEESGKN